MTTTTRLTGDALLQYVKTNATLSKTEQCLGAGYVRDNNGPEFTQGRTPAFTDFYTALLEAKGLAGELSHKHRIISENIPSHDGPAIYVACLASYNNGILYGRWISLEWCTDLQELENAVQEVLKGSPTAGAEEWAVHDSQGLPSFLEGEHPDLSDLNDWAEETANVSDRDAYLMACENEGAILSEDGFNECYYGHFSSEAQFAEDYYEQQGSLRDMPSELVYAIDWDRVWNSEFDCAGWSSHYANGGYYIFSN